MTMLIYMWLWCLHIISFSHAVKNSFECRLHRVATKHGFHRELTTEVLVDGLPQTATSSGCEITLVEAIPPGMYADLYQLKAAEDFGGPMVYSPVDIELEKPEYLSQSHTIYVFGNLSDATSHSNYWSVTVPLHLRYHRPQLGDDMATVILQPPHVLLSCKDSKELEQIGKATDAPCQHQPSQDCQWRQIKCTQGEAVEFQVPVGRQEHQVLVVWGTLAVTVMATAFLSYVILKQNLSNSGKLIKKKDK